MNNIKNAINDLGFGESVSISLSAPMEQADTTTFERHYLTYEGALESAADFALYAEVEGPIKSMGNQYKLIITVTEI